MIEALVPPARARKEPWLVFLVAFIFVSLAIAVSIAIPSVQGGAVWFALLPSIPLLWSLLVREEREEEKRLKMLEVDRLAYHLPLYIIFAFYFLGAATAYAAWYALLPSGVSSSVFSSQVGEIKAIGLVVQQYSFTQVTQTGGATLVQVIPTAGRALGPGAAVELFKHNLVVLSLMFLMCLVYGVGSVYLLLWNASVLGVFVGQKFREHGLDGFLYAVLGIFPHGILEIGAYFIASIAGGMLSMALMHHHHRRKAFAAIACDIIALTLVSVSMLFIAALLECGV